MQNQRQLSTTINWTDVLPMVARDLVRLAVGAEGLEQWLEKHGGDKHSPSRATRTFAHQLFGDTDEADVLNAIMILEVDRTRRLAA